MGKRVYVVILNYNNGKDTMPCLDSIYQSDYEDYRVVVCDNASTDDSMQVLHAWQERMRSSVVLLETGGNLGYAGGNNVGMRYALQDPDCAYIWLLNNDTIVQPDAMRRLVEHMERESDLGICGSLLRYYYAPDKIQAISGIYHKFFSTQAYNITEMQTLPEIVYPVGASMMVCRRFIEEIGLLSEEYFLYYEELDWVLRAKGKFAVGTAVDSVVYHKEGGTTGGGADPAAKSELADFYALRNRILFTRKYFPYCLPTVYLGLFLSMLKRAKRRQWQRIQMIWDIIWRMPESYFSYREHRG